MDTSEQVMLFQQLALCGGDLYTWRYDSEGRLLSSNCPGEAIFDRAFELLGGLDRMLAHAEISSAPIMVGSQIGLIWGAAFERREDKLYRAYVLGPVFFSDISIKQIRDGLANDRTISDIAWKSRFTDQIKQIPQIQFLMFNQYLRMLHYCLTGEQLSSHVLPDLPSLPGRSPEKAAVGDRYRIWSNEQVLLQMVRNGDLDYQDALRNASMLSNGVPLQGGVPLRQAKNSVIVFCSLICRAAIEGGLSPEEGYSLGDAYIQQAEESKTIDELSAISYSMYGDFIQRVHKCRTNPKLSPAIQKCCDYVELNLPRKLQASDLAALVGYSEYYLTKKFKAETGYSVNDYIKFAKIERAKLFLQDEELSILDVAESLGFSSYNYFSRSFKQVTGMTPTRFREKIR